MRPIGGVSGTTAAAAGTVARRERARVEAADAPAAQRALIAVAPAARSELPPAMSSRPMASFLAQLIATAEQVPQTRARRRVDPEVAATHYRAAAAEIGAPAGHRLARSC